MCDSGPPTNACLASTTFSDGDSDKENTPFPKTLPSHYDEIQHTSLVPSPTSAANHEQAIMLQKMKSSPPVSRSLDNARTVSDNEYPISVQAGDSPFHADGESSEDGVEYKMLSFLERREHYRRSRRPDVKSVKWDPAVVELGPLAAITNKSQADLYGTPKELLGQQMASPTKTLHDSLMDLAHKATELTKDDRQKLQKILEAIKYAESSDESVVITRPKKDRKPLGEIKLRDESTEMPMTSKSWKNNKESASPAKRLNPAAPVYRNFADVKARISPQKENVPQPSQVPLHVQRKRRHPTSEETIEYPYTGKPNKYIPPALRVRNGNVPTAPSAKQQEPIWVNTDKLPAGGDGVSQISDMLNDWLRSTPGELGFGSQALEETQEQHLAPVKPQIDFQAQTLPPAWIPVPNFNAPALHPSWCPLHLPEWCPITFMPLPTMSPPQMPVPQMPLPQANDPKIQIARTPREKKYNPFPRRIPSQSEHGRTAEALQPAWASSLLDKFMAKYPMTGKLIPPAAPSPLPKRAKREKNASEIQQKLEELLLYKKEKKVFEERHNLANMSDSDSTSGIS